MLQKTKRSHVGYIVFIFQPALCSEAASRDLLISTRVPTFNAPLAQLQQLPGFAPPPGAPHVVATDTLQPMK